ncbi:MAG: DUF2156 domain-containing protein [Elusimicrobia bacterium]|nr:DUF2156 domain-containing protein [Elusimicrobiota bacterium]
MMEFLPLEAKDYPSLKPLFAGANHPHSEYSLSSLILWGRCALATDYAYDGDAVFISETSLADPKERFLLLPIPAGGRFPPAVLKKKALEAGFSEYRFVHDSYISQYGMDEVEKYFKVSDQPGYHDYVYRAKDLASLHGRDLAKKRNLARRFEKDCGLNGWTIETARLSSADGQACVECLDRWRTERSGDWTDVLERERKAILAALGSFDALELRGLMVIIAGVARGFGVASRLSGDTGVLHFEKASDRHKGLYQYLDRECARLLFEGWDWINKEGDMEDPGLARAKESYVPAKRVRSYRLETP